MCVQPCQFMKGWWFQEALTIKRFSLWRLRLPMRWLHPSCLLPYCCQNLWQYFSHQSHLTPPASIFRPPPVCLSLSRSHSVPATASLGGNQEPGLPWQLVLSLSLDGSFLDSVSPPSPSPPLTPHNAHSKTDTQANFLTSNSFRKIFFLSKKNSFWFLVCSL